MDGEDDGKKEGKDTNDSDDNNEHGASAKTYSRESGLVNIFFFKNVKYIINVLLKAMWQVYL